MVVGLKTVQLTGLPRTIDNANLAGCVIADKLILQLREFGDNSRKDSTRLQLGQLGATRRVPPQSQQNRLIFWWEVLTKLVRECVPERVTGCARASVVAR